MSNNHLIEIEVDRESLAANGPDAEHERRVAIFDLLEKNSFNLLGHAPGGPYKLVLGEAERKLVFGIYDQTGEKIYAYHFSLLPFRGVIRDYFMICESYHEAIRGSTPMQIEAIDMARRGIHNEGSDLLRERQKLRDRLSSRLLCAVFGFCVVVILNDGPSLKITLSKKGLALDHARRSDRLGDCES